MTSPRNSSIAYASQGKENSQDDSFSSLTLSPLLSAKQLPLSRFHPLSQIQLHDTTNISEDCQGGDLETRHLQALSLIAQLQTELEVAREIGPTEPSLVTSFSEIYDQYRGDTDL